MMKLQKAVTQFFGFFMAKRTIRTAARNDRRRDECDFNKGGFIWSLLEAFEPYYCGVAALFLEDGIAYIN